MVRVNKAKAKIRYPFFTLFHLIYFSVGIGIGLFILFVVSIISFEKQYDNRIYPGIVIDNKKFSGWTKETVEGYFAEKSFPLEKIRISFKYDEKIATLSGEKLKIAYDGKLSAEQGYLIGRSGNFISDSYRKLTALRKGIYLPVVLKYDTSTLDDFLSTLSAEIDTPEENALFSFEKGKVAAFKLSKEGRRLNIDETKNIFNNILSSVIQNPSLNTDNFSFYLPIDKVKPKVEITDTNNLGIKELVGHGESKFAGSIAGRIHNVILASSRINGILIAPGETFSFNKALGDVSAATGYQSAYIIKDGRTVLGDGGGVCQVSTTLFRAALNTGLAITERHAHSYRVGYYEQDSPVGLDSTVYDPSYDLKFKNNMNNYILIQSSVDTTNLKLTFNLYGTGDGRKIEITKTKIWDQSPPPPPLYQDDPTLKKGVTKQVDWEAWGAKTSFDYTVTGNERILEKLTFYSNYQPWRAVFLKGTKD